MSLLGYWRRRGEDGVGWWDGGADRCWGPPIACLGAGLLRWPPTVPMMEGRQFPLLFDCLPHPSQLLYIDSILKTGTHRSEGETYYIWRLLCGFPWCGYEHTQTVFTVNLQRAVFMSSSQLLFNEYIHTWIKNPFSTWKLSKQNFQCLHTQKLRLHCLSAHMRRKKIYSLCNERVISAFRLKDIL